MLVVRAFPYETPPGTRSFVAIGKWDGVHWGHQRLIRAMVARARRSGGTAVVIGFDPMPLALLAPEKAPRALQSPAERAASLAALGVDIHWVIPFTRDVASLEPAAFVQALIQGLSPVEVAVGANFTFGRNAAGTAGTLRQLCGRHEVTVRVLKAVRMQGQTVSSTAVRALLSLGKVESAAAMLGRPFSLTGTVVPGGPVATGSGQEPVPAALQLGLDRHLPAPGRYAVQLTPLAADQHRAPEPQRRGSLATLQIGGRPCESTPPLTLTGLDWDLMGKWVQVDFVRPLALLKAVES